MRVLMAAGGTGGHVFPAIAIAEEVMSRDPSNRVLFIGTARGMAGRVVRDAGYRFCAVRGGGLAGGVSGALSGLAQTAMGAAQAFAAVRDFRPDVAVGTGGYASVPGAVAALLQGVPLAVCEQNSAPGLANKALAVAARRVFLSFPHSGGARRAGKFRLVGNPVRRTVVTAALERAAPRRFPRSGTPTLFILGGSQGAAALNRAIPPAVSLYKERTGAGVRVIHQTGRGAEREVAAAYRRAGVQARVFDFSPAVAEFYAEADLVISRSGAGAVAEMALFRVPSILIPYPLAARGHQRENAVMMERAGASALIDEAGLTKEAVAKTLEKLLNWNTLEAMSRAAAGVAAPDAASRVADGIETLVRG